MVVVYLLRHTQLFTTQWTVAHQACLSVAFPRQKYWSGLPFLSPGDLSDPGIELMSPVSPALACEFFTTEPPGKPIQSIFEDGNNWPNSPLSCGPEVLNLF